MVVTPEFVETLAQGVWAKMPAPAETLGQVVQRVSALLTPAASNLEAVVTPEAIQRALVIHWIKEVLDDPEVCAALREQVEIPWEVLERINPNAAGLDIGAEEIWACVPEGRDENHVQMFPTFTVDLNRLADWLEKCKIDTVAMESTGVYWIPVYELLESRGFKVYLVNARHIKNVPGKKTDVLDCPWIQQLHTYGLLQASFRPEADMCAVRAYVRHRDNWLRYRAAHIQHMHKAWTQMNIQLAHVLKDITGKTGMEIIRAIVAGERDPVKLAQFRDPRCASSQDEIAKALMGHYQAEHVFSLQQALEVYDFYTQQIEACDAELERKYAAFKPVVDIVANPLPASSKAKRRQGNAPAFDLRSYLYQLCGIDLTQVDGIDAVIAQKIRACFISVDERGHPHADST
jgi:transposase